MYILPGIPRLFSGMIENHGDVFKGPGQIFTKELFSQMGEGDFGEALRKVAGEGRFQCVRIGSYPNVKPDNGSLEYRVKVVVEGRNREVVEEAAGAVSEIIGDR